MSFDHDIPYYNIKSAEVIVPKLASLFEFKSVVDVGCGIGTWLHVFKKNGVADIQGIDGDYVDKSLLLKYIEIENFKAHDLKKPIKLEKKYDLVVSLEVAEHIPTAAEDIFVKSLVDLGDIILFSAAIPGQDGEGHVNCHWPSYWQEKFFCYNYLAYDPFRLTIWDDANVEWWYKQNIVIFINKKYKTNLTPAKKLISIVHPDSYILKCRTLDREKSKYHSFKHLLCFPFFLLEELKNRFLETFH